MFNYKIIDEFTTTKVLQDRRYVYDGMFHRLYGPAYLEWYEDGTLYHALWFIDGKQHRGDGPAWQCWYPNGTPYYNEWCINGLRHREDGPAIQHWSDTGVLYYQTYWLYNVEITEEIKEWAISAGIRDMMNMTPEALVTFKLTWEV